MLDLTGSRVVTDTERIWLWEWELALASTTAEGLLVFAGGVFVALLTLVFAGATVPLLAGLLGL